MAEKEKTAGASSKKDEVWAFKPQDLKREEIKAKKVDGKKVKGFSTKIDLLMEAVQQKKAVSFKDISKKLGLSVQSVERIGKMLEARGLVDVQYPATMVQQPRIAFRKSIPEAFVERVGGEVLESYNLNVDFVEADVRILRSPEDLRPFYEINFPVLASYTKIFLEGLRESIAEKIPVDISDVTDAVKGKQLKERFFATAKKELEEFFPTGDKKLIDMLAGSLLHSMYGLGKLELLMADNLLEEVAINSSKAPVTVYHRKFGWMKTNQFLESEEEIANYSSQIARKVGREITNLSPILDAHLLTGDRVNATLFPITSFGNTITIRRFSRRPWTMVDFIGSAHTMSIEMAALLWLAIQYELNIVVAGGTASGKTSALNSLAAFMPSYHRIISIEDVREITLPDYLQWNWLPMTTRNPNPEGLGEVSMLDLLLSSLRMRPDRIILGEIRRQKEAEVLFEAMHTGHSVYSTLHANSAQQVLRRLIEPPISIPPLEVEALDLVLVQFRDRRTNVRRTYEIAELESGVSGEQLNINTIYKWSPRDDSWDKVNEPRRLMQQLNMHTGMTTQEIGKDVLQRAEILQWMLESNLSDVNEVGKVMKLFYAEPEAVIAAAEKGIEPKKLLEA
ncbi:MAG: ATPase, T2SS/T4P/T4SS family [Candidatus Diapherotrites archaeon]